MPDRDVLVDIAGPRDQLEEMEVAFAGHMWAGPIFLAFSCGATQLTNHYDAVLVVAGSDIDRETDDAVVDEFVDVVDSRFQWRHLIARAHLLNYINISN